MKFEKKVIRTASLILSALLCAVLMIGCTNRQKEAALYEYSEAIREDLVYWQTLDIIADDFSSTSDVKTFASKADTALQTLDIIVKNAEERNARIIDPEIRYIDDSYVQFSKDLQSSFKLVKEGINEYDTKKLDAANVMIKQSINNMGSYVEKIAEYEKRYDIKTNDDLDQIRDEIVNFGN